LHTSSVDILGYLYKTSLNQEFCIN
jgi:hypothetical protein